uniref:Uncharacterized protein n=1 Tax=Caenorhabditis japonica TaxID=281687 RepID=A0A8R1IX02_CAEJA
MPCHTAPRHASKRTIQTFKSSKSFSGGQTVFFVLCSILSCDIIFLLLIIKIEIQDRVGLKDEKPRKGEYNVTMFLL